MSNPWGFTPEQQRRHARQRRQARWLAAWHSWSFCFILLGFWLLHVLVLGWFSYLFRPETYLIRAGDILADIEIDDKTKGKVHRLWWNRHNCAAARKAVALNTPDAPVRFTLRQHPFFLDSELLSVRSKGYNARWWDAREKDYGWS
jgi:hypothetical protein